MLLSDTVVFCVWITRCVGCSSASYPHLHMVHVEGVCQHGAVDLVGIWKGRLLGALQTDRAGRHGMAWHGIAHESANKAGRGYSSTPPIPSGRRSGLKDPQLQPGNLFASTLHSRFYCTQHTVRQGFQFPPLDLFRA